LAFLEEWFTRYIENRRATPQDDVLTHMALATFPDGSAPEVIDVVRALGGIAVAAGSIIDRSGGAADLGIPRVALETLAVPVWEPEQCPLCLKGEPVTKPGSRPG